MCNPGKIQKKVGKLKSNDQLQGHSDSVSDHEDNDVCHSDDHDDDDVGDDNDVDVDDDDNDDEAVGLGSGALLNIGARPKTSPWNLPRPLSTPLTFDFTHEQCRRTNRYIHIYIHTEVGNVRLSHRKERKAK